MRNYDGHFKKIDFFPNGILLQNIKKIEGGPFVAIKNFSKKVSLCRQKIKVKNTKIATGGSLVCFRASGRRFCFGRGSDVSSTQVHFFVHLFNLNYAYSKYTYVLDMRSSC